MTATRIIPLHVTKGKTIVQTLNDRTDYAKNPEKTEKGELVTSYECDPITVDEEFMLSKRQYEHSTGRHQKNNVIAYQIRQSFKPGEVTAEEANQIGYELAMSFTKGKHAFIVATHTDRAHIHNHIVFNSTTLDGSRKFVNFFLSYLAVQKISDRLCVQHGLSIIDAKPYSQREKKSDYPQKRTFRDDIEKGLVDIGILLEPIDIEKFEFVRLNLKERWVALMRPDDPLAARETVSPKDLKEKPLILPARANVRNELSNWLGEDFSESQVLFTSNLATNGALMVQAGLGYSIIIEGAIPFWDERKIVSRPLSPEIVSDSVFVWKRSQPLTPTVEKFIAEIRCFLGITG
ncbi:MAG: relaxase/mobilization nuclease domain-containing protein [Clostridiales bacterium]|nr:relaxase/mobilization nuclease domain-containing protein [Clostridiales bacterium]